MNLNTIQFENNTLRIINQQLLPHEVAFCELKNLEDIISAITSLKVRGAPAIGVVAGYGLYLHARQFILKKLPLGDRFIRDAITLRECRPTAVNLAWAVNKIIEVVTFHAKEDPPVVVDAIRTAAIKIHKSDETSCLAIANHGSALIKNGMNILTHCNAGMLATGGIGTALGVIYEAHKQKKGIHVYVDETRPIGQGARLTMWELKQNTVPCTLITDNMAGSLMQNKKIDLVIVGADRVAGNGDVANKIGTYSLAVLARFHHVPFYVAAPLSTFDMALNNGSQIPIEFRDRNEILSLWRLQDNSYAVYNPAFDITPSSLITAIITEKGLITKSFRNKISN
jgi:methylthioribose-1-phosphate isomerase